MIKIDQNYTDYRDDSDPKYPGGKAVNATTSEGTDGTPLLADWMNDVNGALQAIFIEAFGNIDKVSGKPDNVQESDVLKAIKKITQEYTDQINAVEGKVRAQGDIETLRSAKSYIDQTVQAEAQTRAQGDADTLSSAKKYTDELLIKIFQNGYIQWPWMPKPETVFTFEGYRWAEVNYDGCFFRAKGKGANPFNGEEQGDAIRNITGTVAFDAGNRIISCSGVFKTVERGGDRSWTADGYWEKQNMSFDASRVVPTADENRSRNKTFIIWQLKKI